jgi:menaquinol-cytochrome c reductase iron-sulfur subunit
MDEKEFQGRRMDRRSFLVKSLWAMSGVTVGLLSVPLIGALLEPLFRKYPEAWREVGNVEDFIPGKTVLVRFRNASILPWSGETSNTASWLRRVSGETFIAFSVNCTHLGCPVRWVPDAEIFLCPCHGGVYYHDGSYAAGPPPHALNRYPVRVRDGKVEIQASEVPITNI